MNIYKYFEIGVGTVPIVLSCPHGGYKKPRIIPDRIDGVLIPDRNTYIIAKHIIHSLKMRGIDIHYILSKIHRCKIDLNRPPRSNLAFSQSSAQAKEIHNFFHEKIQTFAKECVNSFNKCLFIDLHGFTKPLKNYPDIILGNIFGNTLTIKESKDYWGFSQLIRGLSKHFTLDDGLELRNFNLGYSGGYITYQFYKKNRVNAIQIEIAKFIRLDLNLIKKFVNATINGMISSIDF